MEQTAKREERETRTDLFVSEIESPMMSHVNDLSPGWIFSKRSHKNLTPWRTFGMTKLLLVVGGNSNNAISNNNDGPTNNGQPCKD